MRRILGCLMSFALSAGCVHAQTVSDPSLEVRSHLSGFSGPIAIRFLDLDRAFVIQKDDGKVILDPTTVDPQLIQAAKKAHEHEDS